MHEVCVSYYFIFVYLPKKVRNKLDGINKRNPEKKEKYNCDNKRQKVKNCS